MKPLRTFWKPMKSITKNLFALVLVFSLLLIPVLSLAVEVTLKNSSIEKYMRKVTVDVAFSVRDKGISQVHRVGSSGGDDGDVHVAGWADEIGLPTVAEIMNAKHEPDARQLIESVEGSAQTVRIAGVWRIWPEHGGVPQTEGGPRHFTGTHPSNPDHVFEIHPVTSVEDQKVLTSLRPIVGFRTKSADSAFNKYENVKCHITVNERGQTTTISMGTVGFNYVEFILEIEDIPEKQPSDGRHIFASVLNLAGETVVNHRRMVFVKDSRPEMKIRNLGKGDRLHVLGMPRLNLSLVNWRTNHFKERPGCLDWNIPYEIIIVGVYDN